MATVQNVTWHFKDTTSGDRGIIIKWNWYNLNTASFQLLFRYAMTTGSGETIWMDGGSSSVSVDEIENNPSFNVGEYTAEWTIPTDTATPIGTVKFCIQPKAKTITSNGTSQEAWTAEGLWMWIDVGGMRPSTPTTLDVTIDTKKRTSLVASVTAVRDDDNNKEVDYVEFQLIKFITENAGNIVKASYSKDSEDNTYNIQTLSDGNEIVDTQRVAVSEFDNARIYFELMPGFYYSVRVRCGSSSRGSSSRWSNISDPIPSGPNQPIITSVYYDSYGTGRAKQVPTVRVNWTCDSDNVKYEVQFSTMEIGFKWLDNWIYDQSSSDGSDLDPDIVYRQMKSYRVTQVRYSGGEFVDDATSDKIITTKFAPGIPMYTSRTWFRVRSIMSTSEGDINSAWSEAYEFIPRDEATKPLIWTDQPYVYFDEPGDKILKIYYSNENQYGIKVKAGSVFRASDDGHSNGFLDKDAIDRMDLDNYTGILIHNYDYSNRTSEGHINIYCKTQDELSTDINSPHSDVITVWFYKKPTMDLRITSAIKDEDGYYIIDTFPIDYTASVSSGALVNVIGYTVTIAADEGYGTLDETGKYTNITAGEIVYERLHQKSQTSSLEYQILPQDVILRNGISYTLRVSATLSSGATAEQTVKLRPTIENNAHEIFTRYMFDPDLLSLSINAFAGKGPDILNPDRAITVDDGCTISIYRIHDDYTMIPIAEDIPNQDSMYVVDPHPSLKQARYRVVVTDDIGGGRTFYDTPPFDVNCIDMVLQWDETYSVIEDTGTEKSLVRPTNGSMLRLKYNIDVTESADLENNLIKYVGRKDPVSYYGTQTGYTASWSTDIPKSDIETIRMLRKLQVYAGDVYVREPSGTGYWANVKVTFPITHCKPVVNVSLDISRVEGGK